MARGTQRDRPSVAWDIQWFTRLMDRESYLPGASEGVWLLDGDETGSVQEMDLHAGDSKPLVQGEPGIVITTECEVVAVGVSWLSDNVPSGDWTLCIERRGFGESAFSTVLTFPVSTS